MTTRCIRCGQPTQGVAQYCEDCAKTVAPLTSSLRPIIDPVASTVGVVCRWCGASVPGHGRYCPACGRVVDESVMDYAGFWMRFLAWLIDNVILFVVSLVIALIVHNVALQIVLALGTRITYSIGFWVAQGATPGKLAMGIKIIMTNGQPITAAAAVLRYLGYFASGFTLGIGYLMIAFTSQKRGLHDYIAGTYVVRKG